MRFTIRWTGSEYKVSEPKIDTCEVVTIDEFERLQADNANLMAALPDPNKLDYHAGEIMPINIDSAQSLMAMSTKIVEVLK